MIKKTAAVIFTAVIAAACVFTGCKGESTAETVDDVTIRNFDMPAEGEKIAVIDVKDYGQIKIKLFADAAPKATENFIGLADMGYYNELIFHRVIPNFMIQGGDPHGDGSGGQSMWGGEFDGGVPEGLYHFSGAVAYANSKGTSTDGSQFYIVNTPANYVYYGAAQNADGSIKQFTSFDESGLTLPENVKQMYLEKGGVPFLDGNYTVFGQVFEGLDIVREIGSVETDDNDKPLKQVSMNSVKIEEYKAE